MDPVVSTAILWILRGVQVAAVLAIVRSGMRDSDRINKKPDVPPKDDTELIALGIFVVALIASFFFGAEARTEWPWIF